MNVRDELDRRIQAICSIASTKIPYELSYVPIVETYGWFDMFARTEIEPIAEISHQLSLADAALARNEHGTIQDIRATIREWAGPTAENFSEHLSDTESAIGLQRDMIQALQLVIKAHLEVVQAAQADAISIADKTIDALNQEPDGLDWTTGLRIAGALASIAAIPFTAGTSALPAGALLTAAAAALSLGGELAAQDMTRVEGDTAAAILTSMFAALGDLERAVRTEHERVSAALTEVTNGLNGPQRDHIAPHELQVPKPNEPVTPDQLSIPR